MNTRNRLYKKALKNMTTYQHLMNIVSTQFFNVNKGTYAVYLVRT